MLHQTARGPLAFADPLVGRRRRLNPPSAVLLFDEITPAAPDAYAMLAQDSSPHLVEQKAADTGKTAYYIMRWVNTHQEKGPWSDAVSATIG